MPIPFFVLSKQLATARVAGAKPRLWTRPVPGTDDWHILVMP